MSIDPNDPQYQAYSDGRSNRKHPTAQAMTIMTYAMAASIPVIGVVIALQLSGNPAETTPMMIGVIVGLICAGLIQLLGYKIAPLPADRPVDTTQVFDTYRAAMILRFALAEAPAMVAIAATFAFAGNVASYLPGALIALALMVVHVMPNRGLISRVERRLDADGAHSGLSTLFGY